MKKKILSALLASAMVLSLAACGSTPASTGGSDAASGGDLHAAAQNGSHVHGLVAAGGCERTAGKDNVIPTGIDAHAFAV